MNIGREIVSSLLAGSNIQVLLDSGLNKAWLDSHNSGSNIIFSGTDKLAYALILEHYKRHRKVPALQIFIQHFPEESYKLQSPVLSLDELSELAADKINSYLIAELVGRVIDLHDKDKIQDAVDLLRLESAKLSDGIKSRRTEADRLSDFDLESLLESKLEPGVPFGIEKVDDAFYGFQSGQLISLMGRQKAGKALALDTHLVTPDGWTTMGEVKIGDYLVGSDGKPCKVISATDVMYGHECYEVAFNTGEKIIADADHLWITSRRDMNGRSEGIRTTREIAETVRMPNGSGTFVNRHRIPVASPLDLEDKKLIVDPYVLGYWLGDGTTARAEITCHEDDLSYLKENVLKAGYRIKSDRIDNSAKSGKVHRIWITGGAESGTLQADLRTIGVLGNKRIPAVYLRASKAQRIRLLQGIMDSDGSKTSYGFEISQKKEELLDDIQELMHSLSIKTFRREKVVRLNDKDHLNHVLMFNGECDVEVFSLPRKVSVKCRSAGGREGKVRHVVSVTPVESVPVRCVMVDSNDHTYLCGKGMIPTHNSWLTLNSALNAWKEGYTVLFFSVEMDTSILRQRLLCLGSHVSPSRMRRGTLTDSDKKKVREFEKELSDNSEDGGRFFISKKKSLITLDDIIDEISQYNPNVVYIDGFSFMVDRRTGKMTDDWQANENVAAELKSLCMEEEIVIFVNTQVQEKQHHSRFGIEAKTIAGGTGLLKASDLIIGLDKDTDTREITVNCVRSRFEDFDSVVMEIDWDLMEFSVIEARLKEMGV